MTWPMPSGCLGYLDPPYKATTRPGATSRSFDHDRFVELVRWWSTRNTVLVSEYAPPDPDFVEVWSCPVSNDNDR